MTSRERVLAALRHTEPDRVPVDLAGMPSTGIMAIAYNRLKQHLGMSGGQTLVYDVIQQVARPEREILDLYGADVLDLGQAWDAELDWVDWTLPDGSPAKMRRAVEFSPSNGDWVAKSEEGTVIGQMPADVEYLSQCHWPLMGQYGKLTIEQIREAMSEVVWAALAPPPANLPLTTEGQEDIKRHAQRLYETTDRAIIAPFGGNLLEWAQFLFRIDNLLMKIAEDPAWVADILDKLVEIHLENLAKFLPAVRDYVQIIQMGDDLGTQWGSQISPKAYRELFKPRHRELYQYVKENSDCFLFLHSCGSIWELIPDLIEIGVDIINPVQIGATHMEPAWLKQEFGKDIVFWGGGCDTQRVLPMGTPEEIDAHVRQNIEIFRPGGGFIFTQVHNILSNVPPENIAAMFEAVKKYR